jgi:ABC-type transport system involved in cytochrome bd biosynthesis fused ATPase/permease subunit
VRDADLILVLDDGGLAARGTHEQLLRDSELYNQILGSQLRDDTLDHTRAGGRLEPALAAGRAP